MKSIITILTKNIKLSIMRVLALVATFTLLSTLAIAAANNTTMNNAKSANKISGKEVKHTMVVMETSLGNITIELFDDKAPISVKNFIHYVENGHYNNTIFHRIIPGFVVQGGGYATGFDEKPTDAPIVNEASNGLSNERMTIAMARTNDPNSATSQFYFNLKDNNFLDKSDTSDGYAVFGKIIEGQDVVDHMAEVPTGVYKGMPDVPMKPIFIVKAYLKK